MFILPITSQFLRVITSTALLLALAFLVSSPPTASAEIIDFHPEEDAENIPDILDQDERTLVSKLMGSKFTYVTMPPSPGGQYARVWASGEGESWRNLSTDTSIELPSDVLGLVQDLDEGFDYFIRASTWLNESSLRLVSVQFQDMEGEPTESSFFLVDIDFASKTATSQPIEWLDSFPGSLMGFSQDLANVLVLVPEEDKELDSEPRIVQVGGGRYDRSEREDVPSDLPGTHGGDPFEPMEIHQGSATYAVADLAGGSLTHLNHPRNENAGIAGIAFSNDSDKLALIERVILPAWDNDRQRDNDPPGSGLPSLGTINVREALGMISAEENPIVNGSRLLIFDAADGSLQKTIENSSLPQGVIQGFSFSPTGNSALLRLATRSDLEGRSYPTYAYSSGYEYHLLNSELELDREVEYPGLDTQSSSARFMKNGDLALIIADELSVDIVTYDPASGDSSLVWDGEGSLVQAFVESEHVVLTYVDVDKPMEIWADFDPAMDDDAATATINPVPVSSFNTEVAELSHLNSYPISWESSRGVPMEGIWIQHENLRFPPAEPGPVVVWQQGGPGGQMTNDFGTSVESPYSILPNLGIPVFVANAAGRSVKNQEFFSSMADAENFGQLDIEQIKEGVEHLAEEGIVDLDRVGLTGCSYGGYFALQSIRTYPDFYAAANPQCSLVDLFEEFSFGYTPFISYLMGSAPTANALEYMKDSPMYGSNKVKTPTLIFHGREDFLPFQLMNNIHDQIESNGTEVTFFRVAEEGHGFGYPSSQNYAAQLQVEFFRDKLGIEKFVAPEPQPAIYLPLLGLKWDE